MLPAAHSTEVEAFLLHDLQRLQLTPFPKKPALQLHVTSSAGLPAGHPSPEEVALRWQEVHLEHEEYPACTRIFSNVTNAENVAYTRIFFSGCILFQLRPCS